MRRSDLPEPGAARRSGEAMLAHVSNRVAADPDSTGGPAYVAPAEGDPGIRADAPRIRVETRDRSSNL
jgi:hypothetical protein